jgi:hypothetical protein
MTTTTTGKALTFLFRGRNIPATFSEAVRPEVASLALRSEIFCTWRDRCEQEHEEKRLELHSVEIQSVDLFGPRYVGLSFQKVRIECSRMNYICQLLSESAS